MNTMSFLELDSAAKWKPINSYQTNVLIALTHHELFHVRPNEQTNYFASDFLKESVDSFEALTITGHC